MTDKSSTQEKACTLDRRQLLLGMGTTLAWSATLPASQAWALSSLPEYREVAPRLVIYADCAHISCNPHLDTWAPPASYASATNSYVAGLDRESFLSRHWFA